MLTEIAKIVHELGFPVFVAVYLLIWTSKLLRSLTTAITELTVEIRVHNNKSDRP